MIVTRQVPIEVPVPNENPDRDENSQGFEIRIPKNKPSEQKTKTSNLKHKHEYEIMEMFQFIPKVSLSWKKNIESVINWMDNHMEAFHETHKGFLVDFIDDNWKKWYRVMPQNVYEIGDLIEQVEINWKKYNILEHTFTRGEYEMYKTIENEKKQADQEEIYKEEYEKIISDASNNIGDILWGDDKNMK